MGQLSNTMLNRVSQVPEIYKADVVGAFNKGRQNTQQLQMNEQTMRRNEQVMDIGNYTLKNEEAKWIAAGKETEQDERKQLWQHSKKNQNAKITPTLALSDQQQKD